MIYARLLHLYYSIYFAQVNSHSKFNANKQRTIKKQQGDEGMKFSEKVRTLRQKEKLTQLELAQKAGLALRTISYYESGKTYPKSMETYEALAKALGCEADYLRGESEGEDFIRMAQQEYGYRGKKGAERLMKEVTGLFAGGEMAEEDMDEMMLAIQEAYIIAKRNNQKYTPKKYRKNTGGEGCSSV